MKAHGRMGTISHPPATDQGTVLRPDQAALVAEPDGSYSLLLPDTGKDDLPPSVLLLGAVALRIADPEWVAETLEILTG